MWKLIEGYAAEKEATGRLGVNLSAAVGPLDAGGRRRGPKTAVWPSDDIYELDRERGLARITELRHGSAVAGAFTTRPPLPTPDTPPVRGAPGEWSIWTAKYKQVARHQMLSNDSPIRGLVCRRRTSD